MPIRSLICATLGHVDHGKSSILDRIRGTAIVKSEAGQITQAIGASVLPLDVIKSICGDLLSSLKIKLTLPGLLFIDTPGHAAFTTLRRRGCSLADIAIVVIDINEGFKPQTVESIKVLRQCKTPFVVAANKVDLLPGWRKQDRLLMKDISLQDEMVLKKFETKLYGLVARFSELGINAERFDRVEDHARQVAIVPCSAKTGEGMPELLMVLAGLAQKYLEDCLKCNVEGPAKGTVLEVKKEKGLGLTLDVIIYDGKIRKGDVFVVGGLDKPIVTKVKALFEPAPLAEMRDKKTKFRAVGSAVAATGIKVSALGIEDVIAGMPVRTASQKDLEKAKQEVQKEVDEVLIKTDSEGVVVKADTIGSLEAVTRLLKENNISIRSAYIGEITKKDVLEAEANLEKDPLKAAVIGFNVNVNSEAAKLAGRRVKIVVNDVIYRIVEDFSKWVDEEKKKGEARELDFVVRPCKFQILQGYVFRQNNPAVVGIEVLAGILKVGTPVMKNGKEITEIKSIQLNKKSIAETGRGKQVAVSMEKVTVGRQISEGDVLYSVIPEDDFRRLKKLKQYLTHDEIAILKEIAEQMRAKNTLWGI